MSDSELNPVNPAPDAASTQVQSSAPAAQPTAGQILHNARRATGLSLDELAARVKVPASRLQALEDDRFDDWPDMNVVRAMAATVCRHVRLDAEIVLTRLPKAEKKVWTTTSMDSPVGFRDTAGFKFRSSGGLRRMPLALLALALAMAAAGLYFGSAVQAWVERAWTRAPHSSTAPAPGAAPEPVLPPDAGPTDTRIGAVPPEAQASTPEAAVSGTLAVPPPSPLLSFTARGLTWVAVTDVNGVSLLKKTLSAGETASASAPNAALPLWVVVGRADQTEVQVRGQPLKLEPSVSDNVARFKVQ